LVVKYVSFLAQGNPAVGLLEGDKVYDLRTLVAGAPTDIIAVIKAGAAFEQSLAAASRDPSATLNLSDLKLLPAVPAPGKIVCLGLNYLEHAKEGGREAPQYPALFLRVQSSLAAADETIVVPPVSDKFDYEAELMIVIGRTAKNVPQERALDYIFGYTAFNDISVRDYQRRTPQWTSGKNFDRTGPVGPAVVTADELPPAAKGLSIRSRLNGTVMQDGNTADMLFDVPRIIADVSEIMTLEPGDVIATGTPSGVGFARTPPVWMKAGDIIQIEIEGIPTLVNTIG
jgi:acylpyruvate hydrolase